MSYYPGALHYYHIFIIIINYHYFYKIGLEGPRVLAVALSAACLSAAAALLAFSLFHVVCRRLTGRRSSLGGNSNSSSESEVSGGGGILC